MGTLYWFALYLGGWRTGSPEFCPPPPLPSLPPFAKVKRSSGSPTPTIAKVRSFLGCPLANPFLWYKSLRTGLALLRSFRLPASPCCKDVRESQFFKSSGFSNFTPRPFRCKNWRPVKFGRLDCVLPTGTRLVFSYLKVQFCTVSTQIRLRTPTWVTTD